MEPQSVGDKNTYGQRYERVRAAGPPSPVGPAVEANQSRAVGWPVQPGSVGPAGQQNQPAPAGASGQVAEPPIASLAAVAVNGDEGRAGMDQNAPAEAEIAPYREWGAQFVLIGVLYFLAIAIGLVGVLGGLYTLSQAAMAPTGGDWLRMSAWLLAGLGLSGLLAGCAGMLSNVSRQASVLAEIRGHLAAFGQRLDQLNMPRPMPMHSASVDALAGQTGRALSDRLDKLADAVEVVASDCLLDEAGRSEKRRLVLLQKRDAASEQIRAAISQGDWGRAGAALDRFRASHPADADLAARLAGDLARRRDQAEADDLALARRQCDELLSISAWGRAAEVAGAIVQRHPDSTPAKALAARIDRERRVAQEQQRQALYGQIQRHTTRREWKEAVAAAHRLINQFPTCIEADAVKGQMGTLVSNAEIQQRQAMEASIKDLVKRRRYDDAVILADELIRVYPNSPQAAALRRSIDQLRGKAAESADDAKRRRVQW